jgi:4-amino-4-deoxy-L-arabinose transferase-like glycosyltransferase
MTVVDAGPVAASARQRQPSDRSPSISATLTGIPLVLILLVQAVISIRILPIAPASGDEALYIYSGHQLISELWNGGGSPYYETYFSGAPVIYPVFAAMLDHIGGLALVRLASGAFMLAATALLYATARRLLGYWPAVAAAALFASLGITQGLGAYATFDAMALALMAVAAYCSARAVASSRWLLVIPVFLLLANATKYASVVFDPVVIVVAALMLRPQGWQRVYLRVLALTSVTALLIGVCVVLAGTAYFKGILFTTVARKTGTGILNLNPASTSTILRFSWNLIGLIVVLGALAVIVSVIIPTERSLSPVLLVLATAGILVTLEAIHLQDLTSVNKHDDFGAWFTAMPAGYLLARGAEVMRRRYARAVWVIPAAAVLLFSFHTYSHDQPIEPAPSLHGVSLIVPYLRAGSTNRYLIGGRLSDVILYDYRLAIPWQRAVDDNYVKYPLPGRGGDASGSTPGLTCSHPALRCVYLQGTAGARAAIRAHWFAVISFLGQNYLPVDRVELDAVRTTPGYELVSAVGGNTYVYAPDYFGARSAPPTPMPARWRARKVSQIMSISDSSADRRARRPPLIRHSDRPRV